MNWANEKWLPPLFSNSKIETNKGSYLAFVLTSLLHFYSCSMRGDQMVCVSNPGLMLCKPIRNWNKAPMWFESLGPMLPFSATQLSSALSTERPPASTTSLVSESIPKLTVRCEAAHDSCPERHGGWWCFHFLAPCDHKYVKGLTRDHGRCNKTKIYICTEPF